MRYVILLNFTDQGIRNAKQTIERAKAFRATTERMGAKLKDLYWTQGLYDIVGVIDVPDEQTAMALLLALGGLGNVRSQTLRAFSQEEMQQVIGKIP